MNSLRLGLVPYLNLLPLLEGLEEEIPRENWTRATPRQLARLLESGAVDIASLSTFEGLRCSPRYQLLPGAAIASNGPVRSVMLYSRLPISRVQSVLLDCSSLTSIHLVQLLLRRVYGVDPAWTLSGEPVGTDYPTTSSPHDAFLVIGDVALAWEDRFSHHLDLGAAWKVWTGLPFVFAGWFAREDLHLAPAQAGIFARARQRGSESLDSILHRLDPAIQQRYGGHESLRHYFSEAVRYDLGQPELDGIDLFRRLLIEEGFLPGDTPPVPVMEASASQPSPNPPHPRS